MAGRIRSIKPELLEDDKTSSLSDAAWRLFVSLWLLADDYGNARAGGRYLSAMVWQDTTRDAKAPMLELAQLDLVKTYSCKGQPYVSICGWSKHQRVDNAGKPRVPGPSEQDDPPPSENLRESPGVAARPTTPTPTPTPTPKRASGKWWEGEYEDGSVEHEAFQIWNRFCELRRQRFGQGRHPQKTKKRMFMVRDRIKEFGFHAVWDACENFLSESSWYVANGKCIPEYLFRSAEQVEKSMSVGNRLQSAAAQKSLSVNQGSLPNPRSLGGPK